MKKNIMLSLLALVGLSIFSAQTMEEHKDTRGSVGPNYSFSDLLHHKILLNWQQFQVKCACCI